MLKILKLKDGSQSFICFSEKSNGNSKVEGELRKEIKNCLW